MAESSSSLKFKPLWLVVGYALIAFVVHASLTTSPVDMGFNLWDKYAHTLGYFVLMGWFVQIYHQPKTVVFWGIFFVSMGIGLEFLQELGGVRQFEVYDMMANTLGVVIAWLLSGTVFSRSLLFFESLLIKKT